MNVQQHPESEFIVDAISRTTINSDSASSCILLALTLHPQLFPKTLFKLRKRLLAHRDFAHNVTHELREPQCNGP